MKNNFQSKYHIKKNILNGVNVLLPIIILVFITGWVFRFVFALIKPIVFFIEPKASEQTILTKLIALAIVTVIIYLVGAMIRNKAGRKHYRQFESRIFKILPGYTWIKETLLRFLGTKKAPFSKVALVRPFDNNTYQIGFVTDEHEGGGYTIFVPTGPNPTSGNIFILPAKQVKLLKMPVDQAMKMIISCGIDTSLIVADDEDKSTNIG